MTIQSIRIGAALGMILCLMPVFSVLLAQAIAKKLNCEINEGSATTCLWNGHDIGSHLYSMFVLGWLGLVTVPAALIILVSWLGIEIFR